MGGGFRADVKTSRQSTTSHYLSFKRENPVIGIQAKSVTHNPKPWAKGPCLVLGSVRAQEEEDGQSPPRFLEYCRVHNCVTCHLECTYPRLRKCFGIELSSPDTLRPTPSAGRSTFKPDQRLNAVCSRPRSTLDSLDLGSSTDLGPIFFSG